MREQATSGDVTLLSYRQRFQRLRRCCQHRVSRGHRWVNLVRGPGLCGRGSDGGSSVHELTHQSRGRDHGAGGSTSSRCTCSSPSHRRLAHVADGGRGGAPVSLQRHPVLRDAVGHDTRKAGPATAVSTSTARTISPRSSSASRREANRRGSSPTSTAEDPGDGAKQIWRCISPPAGRSSNPEPRGLQGRRLHRAVRARVGLPVERRPDREERRRSAAAAVPMNMAWSDDGDWLMSRTASEGAPKYHFNGFEFLALDAPPGERSGRHPAALPVPRRTRHALPEQPVRV